VRLAAGASVQQSIHHRMRCNHCPEGTGCMHRAGCARRRSPLLIQPVRLYAALCITACIKRIQTDFRTSG
jgi:hypothetical protein